MKYDQVISKSQYLRGLQCPKVLWLHRNRPDLKPEVSPTLQNRFDIPPNYYIFGGIILQELSREYLKTWGNNWQKKADKRLLFYFDNYMYQVTPGKGRIVILNKVLRLLLIRDTMALRTLFLKD